MNNKIKKWLIFVMIAVLISTVLSGCLSFDNGRNDFEIYLNYQDIPGITPQEIAAVESLKEKYDSFSYAMPASTEAFIDESGNVRGFAALVCEWLTELFGIPFVPQINPLAEVLAGLQAGEIDFSGTLTPTKERLEIFHMTDPIALRTLKYFRLKESESLATIRTVKPPVFALLEGSSVMEYVIAALDRDTYEVYPIENNSVVYQLLKDGTIDAFIHENPTEAIFADYTDVITSDFLPPVISPVSLTAYKAELAPIISVMQKAIENDGMRYLTELYNKGHGEYKNNKFLKHLTDEEMKYIENNPVIKYVGEHDNYPVSFYNSHAREFQGISHDVLREIEILSNLSFELINDQYTDWAEILVMLEVGEAAMVTELIRTPERAGRFLWPEAAVLTDHHALISKEEHFNIRINEILFTRVGLAEGYAHSELFKQWFPSHRYNITFDNFDQAFAALEAGEIDMVMGSHYKVLYQTNFREKPGFKANLIFDHPYISTYGFNINEPILCAIIDKAIDFVDTESIAEQWMRKTYDYRIKLQQQQLFWVIGLVVLVFCIIFLLYLSWAKMRLEKESRYKSQFLATMSHEIRTPLNAIIGISQIQLKKEDLSAEFSSALRKIYNSSKSLLGIINDILDLSKIETGKLKLNPVEYNVPGFIHDTVQLNLVRLETKPVEFKLDIDGTLPSRLYGDELRIKQILNNLLSNAIKYTDTGFIKLSVRHTFDDTDVVLLFTVEDSGQGIRPEDRQKLFSEYFHINTEANRTAEGTGLGLSITKRLVEMMDGSITVKSEFGEGSIFSVTIRQGALDCSPIGPELAESLSSFSFIGDRQNAKNYLTYDLMPYGKVLIVDDVETNLFVAEGLMAPYKLNIETAFSGSAAIDKVKSGKEYDIIFMDHMMPLMDGIETTHKLRGMGYEGIIVALTANALAGNEEMFMNNGFDGFVAKPIDVRKLNDVLNRFIRDRHPEEAGKIQSKVNDADNEAEQKTNQKLMKVFRRDAERAVVVLRDTFENGDNKMFTTTVHAMKSALANVGEHDAAGMASALENAGLNGDMAFIRENLDGFIDFLDKLAENLRSNEYVDVIGADVEEDKVLLKEKLLIIKAACMDYNDDLVYNSLEELSEKQWKSETLVLLEEIYDKLYLHSDFDGVVDMIDGFIK